MTTPMTYSGFVKTGRGGGVNAMSAPGTLDDIQHLTGLRVVPVTLNLDLTEPLDLRLLRYVSFADLGWDFNPASQGIRFRGKTGMYFRKTVITGDYSACVLSFIWVNDPFTDIEIISPFHLRTVLHLKDGDLVNLTLE
ncbi:MAG: DUF120 domain-containing protein [Dehalococcoidales bacterium]|nr:DUF120 domain-containing protein [Dehalococcoidales bacterium]